jgi:hypothetical protein
MIFISISSSVLFQPPRLIFLLPYSNSMQDHRRSPRIERGNKINQGEKKKIRLSHLNQSNSAIYTVEISLLKNTADIKCAHD